MSAERCDVLIVGGGPAGSSCAARLRRGGLDVLVLDKRTFPRDKTCAGWVTPPVLETLSVDPAEYAVARTLQPITGFRTGVIGGREVFTDYGRIVSYGIRRCEFDHYLLERSGARLRLGESFRDMRRDGDRWIVNDAIETPLVIGAGGHFCPIARRLGSRANEASTVVAAQEIEFELPASAAAGCRVDPAVPELYFCEDLKGYGWCFRKGAYVNIGLGRSTAEGLTTHVNDFCEFLRARNRFTAEIPGRMHGHAYQLYEKTQPKLFEDGVLLVGDAVGLAYPQSGEGIRPAVESGLMAADVVLAAAGDYSASRLEAYREKTVKRFGVPRPRTASDWLPAAWLRFAAARCLSSRWFSRRVVLDRWFLHADEPALTAT